MNRVHIKAQLITKTQRAVLAGILAALIFVLLHTFVHNEHDHAHDTSCGVYVLEKLFFSHEGVAELTQETLFTHFTFLPLKQKIVLTSFKNHFSIRAPPHFYTL